MKFEWILSLIAGLGFFLYGMKIMGDGLEKTAGDKLSGIIDVLTQNKYKGVVVGALVTALIQSSSAMTVMVVGFINAGIMNLVQGTGVIMGANIGTTITAFLISLEDINLEILKFIKPSFFAPILAAVGVALILFTGKKKYNNIGMILAGFGFLFVGLGMMESSVSFLKDFEGFKQAMSTFSNPVVGVLVGAGVTAIIQSSSASVGILQAVAATTFMPFSAVVPIILGQNIGTCVTAILSSIGANKNAKRAAMIHLMFNVFGTVFFLILLYGLPFNNLMGFWDKEATRLEIAVFHLIFNITNTIVLLPFTSILVKVATAIIPGIDASTAEENKLDTRLLTTPGIALNQAVKEVVRMFEIAGNSLDKSIEMIHSKGPVKMGEIDDLENYIDDKESKITQYLSKITEEQLSEEENAMASALFHVVNDIERIGDHAYNIAETTKTAKYEEIYISELAKLELDNMIGATQEIVALGFNSLKNMDSEMAKRIQPCEDIIDLMKSTYKMHHVDRLTKQECNFKSGVVFLEILNNLERIADHCSNIGIVVEQLSHPKTVGYDQHRYMRSIHQNKTKEYEHLYDEYLKKYKMQMKSS